MHPYFCSLGKLTLSRSSVQNLGGFMKLAEIEYNIHTYVFISV